MGGGMELAVHVPHSVEVVLAGVAVWASLVYVILRLGRRHNA